jgi:hypothetical protein
MAVKDFSAGLQAVMHIKNVPVTVARTYTLTGDSVATASYPSSTGQYHFKSANGSLSTSDTMKLFPMPSSAQVIAGGIQFTSANSTSTSSVKLNLMYNAVSIATGADAKSSTNIFSQPSSATLNTNSTSGNYIVAKLHTASIGTSDVVQFRAFCTYIVDPGYD